MPKKLTPIRLEQADLDWMDSFVKATSNVFESRSNFIRVAITQSINREKENGST